MAKARTEKIKVAEMFAGVGGFRLALDGYHNPNRPEFDMPAAGPYQTVWANQWEPPGISSRQFAWRCYEEHFGAGSCVNKDINKVLDDYEMLIDDDSIEDKTKDPRWIPDFDMLVGGFPCQDYSVAKPLKLADGIEGKKGILWWDIYRMLHLKMPKLLLLENVDRLLTSSSKQRGKDFAVMLSCLAKEGYSVEWRVVNAADYGMPQRRRRVYIFGVRDAEPWNMERRLFETGIMQLSFPATLSGKGSVLFELEEDPYDVSQSFGVGAKKSAFENAGIMQHGKVLTAKMAAKYQGKFTILKDIVVPDAEVPAEYFISEEQLPKWEYYKGSKREERTTSEGYTYLYSEGPVAFPDSLDKPSRTILTSEGGKTANRMKHVVKGDSGKLRRLVPDELDQCQMFPKGWTGTGMTDGNRAFCMGNALVVGIPHIIGIVVAKTLGKK